jgi:hypothetical protein
MIRLLGMPVAAIITLAMVLVIPMEIMVMDLGIQVLATKVMIRLLGMPVAAIITLAVVLVIPMEIMETELETQVLEIRAMIKTLEMPVVAVEVTVAVAVVAVGVTVAQILTIANKMNLHEKIHFSIQKIHLKIGGTLFKKKSLINEKNNTFYIFINHSIC